MTGWRRQVTKKMPAGDAIFVGQNEGTSRCARTKWASPFVPGQHRTPAECFTKYVVCFHAGGQQELRAALSEIMVTQASLAPARSAPAVQRRGRLLNCHSWLWRHWWYQLQHGTQARATFDNVGPSMGLTLQFEVSSPLNGFRELPSQTWRTS